MWVILKLTDTYFAYSYTDIAVVLSQTASSFIFSRVPMNIISSGCNIIRPTVTFQKKGEVRSQFFIAC